jgi:hypothetical protein
MHPTGAAGACQCRSILEGSGDLGVRALGRKRKVEGAQDRIVDDLRNESVYAASLVRGYALVDDRREERVREANRPVLMLDHVRGKSGLEHVLRDAHVRNERRRWTAQCRCEQQALARARRKSIEACAHESLQRCGNVQRLHGVDVPTQNPGELERVERVSARDLMHTQKRRPRERPAEPCLQEAVCGAETEGADRQPLNALALDRPIELRRLRSFPKATGEQQEDRLLAHPPQGKRQHARRGRIEPLEVVDSEHERGLRSQNVQRAPDGHAECARIRAIGGILDEERHFERAAPRRRQRRQHTLERVLEEVAEAGVGKASLHLRRLRQENPESPRARGVDARTPERRLPDPRLALEQECRRSRGGPVEDGVQGAELPVSAYDFA